MYKNFKSIWNKYYMVKKYNLKFCLLLKKKQNEKLLTGQNVTDMWNKLFETLI